MQFLLFAILCGLTSLFRLQSIRDLHTIDSVGLAGLLAWGKHGRIVRGTLGGRCRGNASLFRPASLLFFSPAFGRFLILCNLFVVCLLPFFSLALLRDLLVLIFLHLGVTGIDPLAKHLQAIQVGVGKESIVENLAGKF